MNLSQVGKYHIQPTHPYTRIKADFSRSECQLFGERFCVIWSTSGYLAQLSLVPCLLALCSLLFIFLHRGQRTARARARRQQWKLVTVTMVIHFILQGVDLGLIAYVFKTDERFDVPGARLRELILSYNTLVEKSRS